MDFNSPRKTRDRAGNVPTVTLEGFGMVVAMWRTRTGNTLMVHTRATQME